MKWLKEFYSSDNSKVNTGAIIATVAALNALLILNWNFFIFRKPLDTQTVMLLSTLVGLGGWTYHSSLKGVPPPPPKPPGGGP